ncbi:hypothetical protein [Geodermatophilus ruber]|uniref:Uncharacterized protein n=1 Tax=Geodermatophilus ruber TaxID=504800 RepID=A0A1I4BJP1_9ACTN|nr:hypothetical protein [Geodermatophilus ruber]SFK68978.1 hypothetical protein SAMN04488085_10374 [Geodermatophilus ruber]
MTDLVGGALDRLAADLPSDQRGRFLELMRTGLAEFDAVVGPEDQVVEIEAAADVPPGERLAAAERFAAKRRAFTLGRRSGELLTAFAEGRDVAADAERLLAEIETALAEMRDDGIRRELGDYATECRYVLSGGTGPNSPRGSKLA